MAAGRRRNFDPSVKLSKALSYLLRHGAEKEGFKLLPGGFLYVDEILKHKNFQSASLEDIRNIVETNDKKRFALEADQDSGRLKIRANQGHSIQVNDLELQPITNASAYPTVIHGTSEKAYRFIAKQGLKTMGRNHVHFASGEPGENGVISGMRNACSVAIYLDLNKALKDGLQFFLSANSVILCAGNEDGVILPKYFEKVIDRTTGQKLPIPKSPTEGEMGAACSDLPHEAKETTAVTAEEIANEYDNRRKNRRKNKKREKEI